MILTISIGQLKQVDHALAAVAQGTTSLGVKGENTSLYSLQ